jgi:hypothetical protein
MGECAQAPCKFSIKSGGRALAFAASDVKVGSASEYRFLNRTHARTQRIRQRTMRTSQCNTEVVTVDIKTSEAHTEVETKVATHHASAEA